MNEEVIGKLKTVMGVVESGTFKKREFVITTEEQYPQHLKFELHNDKINLLKEVNIGETLKICFNMRGREWYSQEQQKNIYFQSWVAWRINRFENGLKQPIQEKNSQYEFNFKPSSEVFGDDENDLPF